jgi:NADH-quinone oxidoreductase subunit A
MSPTIVAAYSLLFVVLGAIFLAVNLIVGRFLRPKNPNEEKLSVYECGEPTIGSSFVQFDLRFYVVALLFIIFDVEVAFFFPWAVAYGKATHLMDPKFAVVESATSGEGASSAKLTPKAAEIYREFGVKQPTAPQPTQGLQENDREIRAGSALLAKTSIVDILVFFAVLMVGFAYVWSRGDLDWVRAVSEERSQAVGLPQVDIASGSEAALAG